MNQRYGAWRRVVQPRRWMGVLGLVLAWAMMLAPAAAAEPRTVLVMGDSLSAAYGLAPAQGWVSLTGERLAKEVPGWRIVNASISGETTSGGLSRLPALLSQHKPDVVVIELGANDGLRGLPLTQMADNLKAMIDAANTSGAQVLLVGMQMPPNYGRAYTERFAGMYPQLSTRHKVPLVPFMLEGVAQDLSNFQADRIHMRASAHPTILNNIWPHLVPLIR